MALIEKQTQRNAPSVNDYDEDTQAILKEMHGEGFNVDVAGLDGAPAAAAPNAPQAPAAAPVVTPRSTPAVDEDDEPEDEPEEEDGAVAPDAGAPAVEAAAGTPGARSVAEARKENYWREKAKDTEAALATITAELAKYKEKDAFAHIDTKIEEIAKKYGANAGVIKEILTLGKDAFIPPELKEAMADIAAERQQGRFWETKFSQFDNEFETGLLPVLLNENPNITQAEVDKIYAQLGGGDKNGPAWADENAETPLVTLYYRIVKSTQARASSEPGRVRSRGGAPATSGKSLNEMTPEELRNMPDEEFDTFSEGLRGSGLQR